MSIATIKIKDRAEEAWEQADQKERALALLPDTAVQLHQDTEQIGALLMQMGQMIGRMQHRLDEMEARQAAVTISHAEVKRLQALIRIRAEEICEKYQLTDAESRKIFRAAIRRDLLKRFLVRDLHDLPAAALGQAEKLTGSWTNIRMIIKRRGT
jgi:hypothetical protein